MTQKHPRQRMLSLANAYLGAKESAGQHKKFCDVYNSYKPAPRGYKVKYSDSWGCIFISALAIMSGCQSIIPVECSCWEQATLFKRRGQWRDRNYRPGVGDLVYFSWSMSDFAIAEQVGIITTVSNGSIVVICGNCDNRVVAKKRYMLNSSFILGYATPRYSDLVGEV